MFMAAVVVLVPGPDTLADRICLQSKHSCVSGRAVGEVLRTLHEQKQLRDSDLAVQNRFLELAAETG